MGIGNIADTGMQAAMSSMEAISNNIANSNTYGFKKSHVNFADIYPSSAAGTVTQTGLGVSVANVSQDFSSNGYDFTGRPLDLSLTNSGFFVLKDPTSGQVTYTRNGQFDFDDNGYLYNIITGSRVQGFTSVNGNIPNGSTPTDIQVSNAPLPAASSTTLQQVLNIDSTADLSTTPFDPTNTATYAMSTTNELVYDSLGNTHTITLYFIKTAENTYTVNAAVDGTELNPDLGGSVVFSNTGVLQSQSGLAITFSPVTGAAAPQTVTVNLTGSTQLKGQNSVNTNTANGNLAGTVSSQYIDQSGNVYATYTNGQSLLIGQVAVANFETPDALAGVGNMSWAATTASGSPVVNPSNSTNSFVANQLELSNVDLADEMIRLITAQHAFQANAQVEQTYNEVMQTVTQL